MCNGLSYFTHRSLDLGLEKGIILVSAAKLKYSEIRSSQ